jgi:hypothetical protein
MRVNLIVDNKTGRQVAPYQLWFGPGARILLRRPYVSRKETVSLDPLVIFGYSSPYKAATFLCIWSVTAAIKKTKCTLLTFKVS